MSRGRIGPLLWTTIGLVLANIVIRIGEWWRRRTSEAVYVAPIARKLEEWRLSGLIESEDEP